MDKIQIQAPTGQTHVVTQIIEAKPERTCLEFGVYPQHYHVDGTVENGQICLHPAGYALLLEDLKLTYVAHRGDHISIVSWSVPSLETAEDAAQYLHEEGLPYDIVSKFFDAWLGRSSIRDYIREKYDI